MQGPAFIIRGLERAEILPVLAYDILKGDQS